MEVKMVYGSEVKIYFKSVKRYAKLRLKDDGVELRLKDDGGVVEIK